MAVHEGGAKRDNTKEGREAKKQSERKGWGRARATRDVNKKKKEKKKEEERERERSGCRGFVCIIAVIMGVSVRHV